MSTLHQCLYTTCITNSYLYQSWHCKSSVSGYQTLETYIYIFPPLLPWTGGTWFHRFQVPTLQTWESRWSTVRPWRIYFTIKYTWLHKHTLTPYGLARMATQCTFLPAIYISSCWQESPISNFIGKAGLYHWPWYMARLVVTKPPFIPMTSLFP